MGTNYYLHTAICPQCRRSGPPLHIGKSSHGWCFSLHIDPERGINDLDDWKKLLALPDSIIEDEYGSPVTFDAMLHVITCRNHERQPNPACYKDWDEFHRQNHSEFGPNGLVRFKLNDYCVKHGEGTWDCIVGEFS